MNGTSGSPIMTKEEFLRAGPQIANLNVLAGHIIDDVPELKVEAMALLAELVPLVRGYFGDQDFLVPLPSDDPLPPIGDSRSQA
jgi:hypothetical protein